MFSNKLKLCILALLLVPFSLGAYQVKLTTSGSATVTPPSPPAAGDLLTGTEITSVYLGGFRMPATSSNGASPDFSPTAIAYNPSSGGLYSSVRITGGADGDVYKVAEFGIPALVSTASASAMNPATYLQGYTEPLEAADLPAAYATMDYCTLAARQSGSCNPVAIMGLGVTDTKLLVSYGISYDADNLQLKSHLSRPLNLSTTGSVVGPDQLSDCTGLDMTPGAHPHAGGSKGCTGFTAGYMANVPASRQAALGGAMISGWLPQSIITRTSYGPGAGVFDPTAISGAAGARTWTPLVAYPTTHQTLGPWEAAGEHFGIATQVRGAVIFDSTDTVAFFGMHGGSYCYGVGGPYTGSDPGSSNPYLRYMPNSTIQSGDLDDGGGVDVNEKRCADPTNNSKGNHGYPYYYSMWLYDINDFIAVKAGTTNPSTGQPWKPWDILPYERFNITFPLTPPSSTQYILQGAAWDPATRRLFLSQYNAHPETTFRGVVQVFQVPTP